jgi:hypothetical protein
MAYFIETHLPGEWETDEVQTLYMEEWDRDRFDTWLRSFFGADAETIAGPPAAKFTTWSPSSDDESVQIFIV